MSPTTTSQKQTTMSPTTTSQKQTIVISPENALKAIGFLPYPTFEKFGNTDATKSAIICPSEKDMNGCPIGLCTKDGVNQDPFMFDTTYKRYKYAKCFIKLYFPMVDIDKLTLALKSNNFDIDKLTPYQGGYIISALYLMLVHPNQGIYKYCTSLFSFNKIKIILCGMYFSSMMNKRTPLNYNIYYDKSMLDNTDSVIFRLITKDTTIIKDLKLEPPLTSEDEIKSQFSKNTNMIITYPMNQMLFGSTISATQQITNIDDMNTLLDYYYNAISISLYNIYNSSNKKPLPTNNFSDIISNIIKDIPLDSIIREPKIAIIIITTGTRSISYTKDDDNMTEPQLIDRETDFINDPNSKYT